MQLLVMGQTGTDQKGKRAQAKNCKKQYTSRFGKFWQFGGRVVNDHLEEEIIEKKNAVA